MKHTRDQAWPLATAGTYRIEQITTTDELKRLGPAWQALSARAGGALLFNSYEWASACWKHFHADSPVRNAARLCVLAVWDDAALRGVVPMWIETRQVLGLRVRIARFLGEGPSDYGDLLLDEPRRVLLGAVVDYLTSHRDLCDRLELREFFGESPNLTPFLGTLDGGGWRTIRTADSDCYWIPTDVEWDAYCRRQFGRTRRRSLWRGWRRLESVGGFEMTLLDSVATTGPLADALGAVQAAHVEASEHRPGEFNDPTFRPFLEEMLATASAQGWLRLAVMRRDNVPVAFYLAFLYRGRYFLYNTAYRADTQSVGAGKMLMLFMLEKLFGERGGPIDLLRGAESYKGVLTDRVLTNACIRATRPGLGTWIRTRLVLNLEAALQRPSFPLRVVKVVAEEGVRGVAIRILRHIRRRR